MRSEYKRVAHEGFFFRRNSLWLGSDHLLYINGGTFAEGYRRFYLQDIQAIIMQRTVNWHVYNAVFGMAFLLFAALAVAAANERLILYAGAAGFFLLLTLHNSFQGPTCVCYVQTAVQREKISSLNRLNKTRRAIDSLRAEIIRRQSSGWKSTSSV